MNPPVLRISEFEDLEPDRRVLRGRYSPSTVSGSMRESSLRRSVVFAGPIDSFGTFSLGKILFTISPAASVPGPSGLPLLGIATVGALGVARRKLMNIN
jgi:hypothetical protein